MTKFVFSHDPQRLPPCDDSTHSVQLYNIHKWDSLSSSCIARPIINSIRDLGCRISNDSFDFLTIAMSVTAADTFSLRKKSGNSWARELELEIPLFSPNKWNSISNQLEKALGYLTGDTWELSFVPGGLASPLPKKSKKAKNKKNSLRGLDCVSLFSGGLDSAVGAIDLINTGARKPLLVSHAYRGDASKQQQVEKILHRDNYERLACNADPRVLPKIGETEISMRGRSFNFIAMAVAGLSALKRLNSNDVKEIFIPENGYISLNPPLTRRRIGSLSTRTTHPHFIDQIQQILNKVGLNVILTNPYQAKTKGEMLKYCKDQKALKKAIPWTVSCSNWHRKGIQCGRCVPCIIRRASIFHSGFTKDAPYESETLKFVLNDGKNKDDLLAVAAATIRMNINGNISRWVRENGPLPSDDNLRVELIDVIARGLKEIGNFLKNERIL